MNLKFVLIGFWCKGEWGSGGVSNMWKKCLKNLSTIWTVSTPFKSPDTVEMSGHFSVNRFNLNWRNIIYEVNGIVQTSIQTIFVWNVWTLFYLPRYFEKWMTDILPTTQKYTLATPPRSQTFHVLPFLFSSSLCGRNTCIFMKLWAFPLRMN